LDALALSGAGQAFTICCPTEVLNHWTKLMAQGRGKARRSSDEILRSLSTELTDALERGAICALKELSPRQFVDLMTRSSFEIGRIFKRGLRDALYQRLRDARKKI